MNERQHFETQEAMIAALTAWQDESWARQGKPEDWAMRIVRTKLDPVTMQLQVDVLAVSELFLASLPASALQDPAVAVH